MAEPTLHALSQPEAEITDPRLALLPKGAWSLVAKVAKAKLETLLAAHAKHKLKAGYQRRTVVCRQA